MLELRHLDKTFGDKPVFENLSYSFEKNKIYLLSGQNGSGKTTLMKLISGAIAPDAGNIEFCCTKNYYHRVSYVDSNNRSFIHRIKVKDNLDYFMAMNKFEVDRVYLNQLSTLLDANDLMNSIFSSLSSGQMQLISLIRGLSKNPDVLLLDEALGNIDKNKMKIISSYLNKFVSEKERIVIICSHDDSSIINFSEVMKMS